jgi:hypothetical protein
MHSFDDVINECCDRAVSTAVLHFGGPGFKSRPGYWFIMTQVFRGFPQPRQANRQAVESGPDHLHTYPSHISYSLSRYRILAIEIVLQINQENKKTRLRRTQLFFALMRHSIFVHPSAVYICHRIPCFEATQHTRASFGGLYLLPDTLH